MTRLLIVLTIILLILAPVVALGEEGPCRADGDTVVCKREGFDVLVRKVIDARASAEKCVLEAESRTADAKVLDAKLAASLAETEVARAKLAVERSKPKPWSRRFAALGIAAASGVAVGVAPGVSSESVSYTLLGVGVAGFATAALLVALE